MAADKQKHKSPIRDAIRKAIADQGLSGYRLAAMLDGKVSRTAVYRFIGDGANTDVSTAEAFMEVLGLKLVAK
jgi:ribosome-binding protein aMBF1 (putative translation factor)